MADKLAMYNLFWRMHDGPDVIRASLHNKNRHCDPVQIPAMILFPAFLTPALHVRGENEDWLELLLVGSDEPKIDEGTVNTHLKISAGLDPWKHANSMPLFDDWKGKIQVEVATLERGHRVKTHAVFQGFLDHRFVDSLPKELRTFYRVRVKAACLDDPGRLPDWQQAGAESWLARTIEYQDIFVLGVLKAMNGTALGGQKETKGKVKKRVAETLRSLKGRFTIPYDREMTEQEPWASALKAGPGMCCFPVGTDNIGVDLTKADSDQPVRAYHPLFVYGAGGLDQVNYGHVADLHLNARQHVLRVSDARVIDAEGTPGALADSPRIGDFVATYSENFADVLKKLGADQAADVVLVGGDLVDHVHNIYAPKELRELSATYKNGALGNGQTGWTAAKVWELVDLEHGYDEKYHSFVDHLTFYSIVRNFYEKQKKPVFVVSGNHDAYEKAYGISPRFMGVRANEGIAADHNLTRATGRFAGTSTSRLRCSSGSIRC
jgi:hypothetical protein